MIDVLHHQQKTAVCSYNRQSWSMRALAWCKGPRSAEFYNLSSEREFISETGLPSLLTATEQTATAFLLIQPRNSLFPMVYEASFLITSTISLSFKHFLSRISVTLSTHFLQPSSTLSLKLTTSSPLTQNTPFSSNATNPLGKSLTIDSKLIRQGVIYQ